MSQRWRLEARRPSGEVTLVIPGDADGLRKHALYLASMHGQKYWKYDLYCGNALQATYKRGVWTEHLEKKA